MVINYPQPKNMYNTYGRDDEDSESANDIYADDVAFSVMNSF